jgi:hypothetical protein
LQHDAYNSRNKAHKENDAAGGAVDFDSAEQSVHQQYQYAGYGS